MPENRPLLADLRAELTVDLLTPESRRLIADQAALVVDGFYVHLWQKRALYGIDPGRRLQLLRRRAASMPDVEFHAELQAVLADLQDLHTLYSLPFPYWQIASLGFLLERCWDGDQVRWVASHVRADMVGRRSKLVTGAEITHWNGMPIAVAVARNADREPGSNSSARFARGLESMTQRVLLLSPMPDEDRVDLRFTVDGAVRESRVHWQLVPFEDIALASDDDEPPVPLDGDVARTARRGFDRRTTAVQKVKKALFAPPDDQVDAEEIATEWTGVLRARRVTTPSGTFGHLRIYTFGQAFTDFVLEVARLLDEMPRDGLILDVRGNGGGVIFGTEGLLQLFTPGRIQPEPFQMISSDETAALCRHVPDDYGPWAASVDEAIATGAQYSGAIPISTADEVNGIGQRHHGPVLLVTDALCYSATDMLAAGFQDHGIGTVLGVDDHTGAGGANVTGVGALLFSWPGSPFEPLPHGTDLSLSIRRSLRVGPHAGQPLEDFGVVPDERHRLTRRDVLDHNVDLLARAGELPAEQTRRRLDVTARARGGATVLVVTAENVTSVDVYVDDRPVHTAPVTPGRTEIEIPVPDPRSVRIRVEGFADSALVAARDL